MLNILLQSGLSAQAAPVVPQEMSYSLLVMAAKGGPLMIVLLDRVHIGMTADYPALSVTGFTVLLALLCFAVTFIARKIPIVKKLL